MAFASRGNRSMSSVDRTAENNLAFSSSSEEGKEGDRSICCCWAILICRAGRASQEKPKRRGWGWGARPGLQFWSSGA